MHKPSRPLLFTFVLLLGILQGGCAGTAKQQALSAMLVSVDTARIGFVTWDDSHQQEIVTKAASYEEGAAALEEYRKKRAPVLFGFELAYRAIADAALAEGDDLSKPRAVVDNLRDLIKSLIDVALE